MALGLGTFDSNYLDAYYGPDSLPRQAEVAGLGVARVAAAESLLVTLGDSVPAYDDSLVGMRRRYLRRLLAAMVAPGPDAAGHPLQWSAYNWYKGGAHSLIQGNLDFPIAVDRAIDLACHEGYPGHHVYNASLERVLVRDCGRVEYSVYPLFSPMSLIAEGSANFGIDMAFPSAGACLRWSRRDIGEVPAPEVRMMLRALGLPLVAGLLCFGPAPLPAQTVVATPAWQFDATQPIEWLRFLPSRLLLVSSDDGLRALDPADGTIRWRRDDLQNISQVSYEAGQQVAPLPGAQTAAPPSAGAVIRLMEELPGGRLAAILADSGGRHSWFDVIDLANGTTVWSSSRLPITEARGFLLAPDSATLLVHGMLIEPGRSRRYWLRVSAEDGRVLWSSDSLLGDSPAQFDPSMQLASRGTVNGNQPLVPLPDSTVLLFASGDGVVRVDLRDGRVRWRSAVASGQVGPIGVGYAPALLNGDTAYVAAGNFVDAVLLTDGRHLWSSSAPSTMTVQMVVTPSGLLVRGQPTAAAGENAQTQRPYAALLDAATGKPRWRKQFRPKSGLTPFLVGVEFAFLGTDDGLRRIALPEAKDTELTREKFPGRPVISLESREDALLVGSAQALTLLARDGSLLYQKEFPAPTLGLGGRLLRLALGAAAIAGGAYYSGGELAGAAFAKYQYSNTREASRETYFVLKDYQGEGPALGKVDKWTGALLAVVKLGGDKTPEYVIDAYSGLLLLKAGRTLTAYRW